MARSLRRRRQQRGAAFAESTVIASTMVVVLACMWYAFDVHQRKVAVMEQARAEAWPVALNYCKGASTTGGGSGFMQDLGNQAGQSSSDPVNPGSADEYVNTSGKIPADKGYYAHKVSGTVKAGLIPALKQQTMEGKMYIGCNEEPKEGGLLKLGADLVKEALGAFKSKFF